MRARIDNRRQRGLTLVELMVALVLGMLVMAGVIQLFIANKETYRVQDGLARVQEAGRFAVYLLNTDIAGGANLGCTGRNHTDIRIVALDVPAELDFDSNGELSTMAGMDNVSGTVTLPSGTEITPVAGSDVINVRGISTTAGVRYPSGEMDDASDDIDLGHGNLSIGESDLLYIGSCTAGDIFRASNSVSALSAGPLEHGTEIQAGKEDETSEINSQAALEHTHGEDAVIGRLRSHWYYVKLGDALLDGQAVHSLHRVDQTGTDSEIVTGIEDMQITYGINSDGNPNSPFADRYVTAADVTDWESVVSVRINLLVNSVSRAAREAVTYDYSPAGDDQSPADSDDYRLRREFVVFSTLRNHTR